MEQQSRRQRRAKAKAAPKRDYKNMKLLDMRFDTPEASALFFNLRYFNKAYKGSTDNAVCLPPASESVSTTPGSGGMVYKAFPHGLMYGDQLALLNGIQLIVGFPLVIVFLLLRAPGSFFDADGLGQGIAVFFAALMLLILVPPAILLFISGLMGYRFTKSVLLDRNAGRVHVFTDESAPWRGNRFKIASYDWAQVRGEVDTMSVFTGTVGRSEAGLRGVVLDTPGGTQVIDRFPLSVNVSDQNVQPLLDTWEHARRFMEREGPLFADEHDGPNPALGKQALWQYLWIFPVLMLTLVKDFFAIGWKEKNLLVFVMGVGMVVPVTLGFPILLALGLFPWISSLFKQEPKWPAEIMASVGGNALRGTDLEAWRGVVPGTNQRVADIARPGLEVQ